MFKILIVDEHGFEVDSVQSPINPIGADTITTNKGCFQCLEFSVDFKAAEIVVHVSNDFTEF